MILQPERIFLALTATAGLGVSIAAHVPEPEVSKPSIGVPGDSDAPQSRPDESRPFVNWESPHVHPLELILPTIAWRSTRSQRGFAR